MQIPPMRPSFTIEFPIGAEDAVARLATLLRDEAPDTRSCTSEGGASRCNVASKSSPFVSAKPSGSRLAGG